MSKILHSGHRERLRKKFILKGTDGFEDHEILELALFYAIPRKDTNEIAHGLIDKFGSIDSVFDAPINTLKDVDGIGESAAVFIKLIPSLARIYMERKFNSKANLKDLKKLCDRLSLKFIGRLDEVTAVMLFDAKWKRVYEGIVHVGSVNACDVYVRKIIELIALYNACGIILAHNHPSGFAMPSPEDLDTTAHLSKIFSHMKVTFLDHIICADGDYVSLRASDVDGIFSD